MALYTTQIDNYIGGVSQQAYNLRYVNQFNEQINCVSSPVNGLMKRPPLEFIATEENENLQDLKSHKYSRGTSEDENFIISIYRDDENVKAVAYTQNGTKITINDETDILNSYITAGSDINNLKMLSVEDTTFVVNPSKKVEKGTGKSDSQALKCMVYVKQVDYGKTFKITIEGTTVSYTVPDGSSSSDSEYASTDYVATQLNTKLNAAGFSSYIMSGNVIVISITTQFSTLSTSDGLGGLGLIGIKNAVNSFDDLPPIALDGYTIKITETDDTTADDYYVSYDSDGDGDGIGVWNETVAPDIDIEIDNTTMPIRFIYDGVSFNVEYIEWEDREKGDDDSNPFPSFVDGRINDIFIFQDRLGFLTDTYVVLSQTSDYFNFFRNSVITMGDSDVIDIGSNSYDSYTLHSAIEWQEMLLLFSRNKQFTLRGSNSSLTASNVAINQSGSYESVEYIKPQGAGSALLFPSNNGNNSKIYEMFISNYETTEARDISSHVSNYIPKNIKRFEVLNSYNIACFLSDEDTKTIYVYQYLYSSNEKLQSAFHKWTFDVDEIYDFKFIENDLIMICNLQGQLTYAKLELNDIQKDDDLDYKIHLDFRVSESDCVMEYDSETNTTEITTPISYYDSIMVTRSRIRTDDGEYIPAGYIMNIENNGNVYSVSGDVREYEFYIGEKYNQYLEHSTMQSRYNDKVDTSGRVQIMYHDLSYTDSGYYKVTISQDYRSDRVFKHYTSTLGSSNLTFDDIQLKSGNFRYNVKSKNTDCVLKVENDSHLPLNIQSSEYSYRFFKLTR